MQHRSTHQPDVNAARDQLAIQPDVLRVVLVIVVAAQAPNDKRLGPLGSWSGPEQIEIVKPPIHESRHLRRCAVRCRWKHELGLRKRGFRGKLE